MHIFKRLRSNPDWRMRVSRIIRAGKSATCPDYSATWHCLPFGHLASLDYIARILLSTFFLRFKLIANHHWNNRRLREIRCVEDWYVAKTATVIRRAARSKLVMTLAGIKKMHIFTRLPTGSGAFQKYTFFQRRIKWLIRTPSDKDYIQANRSATSHDWG